MATRARVSQRAFFEIFDSAEDCILAAFEEGLARLSDRVQLAAAREESWLGRVHAGLVALLSFLGDEPGWGRLLLFYAPLENTLAFRCEQRLLGVLTTLMDDGSPQALGELTCEPHLTAELVIGGVFSVIRTRLGEGALAHRALAELEPHLMSFIVAPYLGRDAARAQLTPRAPLAIAPPQCPELPFAPALAVSYRTRLVLSAIANAPRSSNRELAAAAGIVDEGQISHLLRRLAHRGLIEKVTPASGSRRENAWLLTGLGRRVIELLGLAAPDAQPPVSVAPRVRQAA